MLFAPFRWGQSWKLSAVAYVARAGTIFVPFPLIYLAFLPAVRGTGGKGLAAILTFGVLLLLAITLVLFYLCSRMQFVLFDLVLNGGQFVGPLWRRYGPVSWPWTLAKVVAGSVFAALIAVPTVAAARRVMDTLGSLAPGQPPTPEFLTSLFAGYALLLGSFGVFFAVSALLTTAMMPSLTLEGLPLGESFTRALRMMEREPGAFALFALLQIVLALVGYVLAVVAFEVVLFVVLAILGALAVGVGFMLHLLGVPTVLLIALGVLLGIGVYVGALVYPLMLAIGPVLVFLEAHALYFLSARTPLVGPILGQSEAAVLPSFLPPAISVTAPPPPPQL